MFISKVSGWIGEGRDLQRRRVLPLDWEDSPGEGNLLQYSCLENPHGQRSLVGYSPWSHKESDTTERLIHIAVLYIPIKYLFILVYLIFVYVLKNGQNTGPPEAKWYTTTLFDLLRKTQIYETITQSWMLRLPWGKDVDILGGDENRQSPFSW